MPHSDTHACRRLGIVSFTDTNLAALGINLHVSLRRALACRRLGIVSFTDTNSAALGINLYRDYDGWGSPGLQLNLRAAQGGAASKRPFTSGEPLRSLADSRAGFGAARVTGRQASECSSQVQMLLVCAFPAQWPGGF